MADLFADENVPAALVGALAALGHDVLTALAAGQANQGVSDADLLAHASSLGRAMLTNNRRHFHKLHYQTPDHAGIITFTDDLDVAALARRIHDAIHAAGPLARQLVRVTRPP